MVLLSVPLKRNDKLRGRVFVVVLNEVDVLLKNNVPPR
jgi:hypothetical protein